MKEIRVICGTTQQDGTAVRKIEFEMFEQQLVREFGGYTQTDGTGAWMSPESKVIRERVKIYDIAVDFENDLATYPRALDLVRTLCRRADQLCVYLRDTVGNVTFVEQ